RSRSGFQPHAADEAGKPGSEKGFRSRTPPAVRSRRHLAVHGSERAGPRPPRAPRARGRTFLTSRGSPPGGGRTWNDTAPPHTGQETEAQTPCPKGQLGDG